MATLTRNFVLLPGFSLHRDGGRLRLAWQRFLARRREAAALRRLSQEDPRTLADLGISRAQGEFEAGRPWIGFPPR